MARPRTIVTKDFTGIREEYVPAAIFSPGHILELTSASKVQKHSSAGQNVAPLMVACEDEFQGKTTADAYAVTGRATVAILRPGDEFYGKVKNGENIAVADLVESDGAGQVQKYVADTQADSSANTVDITVYPKQIIAQALEAVDMSDSSAADPDGWIKLRAV